MKLMRHLAGYLPVNLASAAASFGGVYVFTRLLSADDYGRYALMFSLMSIIHTLTLTWVEAGMYRFTARAEASGALPAHYRRGTGLMLRSVLVAWLLCGMAWLIVRDLPGYGPIVPWLAALLPLNSIVQMALESHKAGQRVSRYAVVETFRLLTGFALGAVLAWKTGLGAAAPFVGLTVAAFLTALSEGAWLVRAGRGESGAPDPARNWIAYGMPVAAALVLNLILSASDRFLIAIYIDEAAVGAYAAGYGVADKTVLLLCAWAAMAGSPLVMAAYERAGREAAREEARGLVTVILLIGMPAATGLALVAQPLATAMIGADLREMATRIIPWIAFAGLLNGLLIHYFSEAFQLARKTALRAGLMVAPALLNVVLNIILLPRLGVMGAVYATVISYGVGILLLAVVGRRFVTLPVIPAEFLRIAAACLAMWPATLIVPSFGGWPELFAKSALGGLVYALAVLALDAGGARKFVADRLRTSNRDASA